jgi:hypothetical protein
MVGPIADGRVPGYCSTRRSQGQALCALTDHHSVTDEDLSQGPEALAEGQSYRSCQGSVR